VFLSRASNARAKGSSARNRDSEATNFSRTPRRFSHLAGGNRNRRIDPRARAVSRRFRKSARVFGGENRTSVTGTLPAYYACFSTKHPPRVSVPPFLFAYHPSRVSRAMKRQETFPVHGIPNAEGKEERTRQGEVARSTLLAIATLSVDRRYRGASLIVCNGEQYRARPYRSALSDAPAINRSSRSIGLIFLSNRALARSLVDRQLIDRPINWPPSSSTAPGPFRLYCSRIVPIHRSSSPLPAGRPLCATALALSYGFCARARPGRS